MKFPPRPDYSKGEVDRAGELAYSEKPTSQEYRNAVIVINAWRISHAYPMHTFNVTLRRKAYAIDKTAIVARRLKRLPTILDKIGSRQSSMRLSRMQDIGGVRAIVSNVEQVYALCAQYTQKGRFPHKLKTPYHDYINRPKTSGYRGIHLVFEFNNSQGRSKNARDYDGLNIELQLRTKLQHAWATAVEAVGVVRHESLKSSIGSKQWLQFFQYMASVMALMEDQPVLESHKGMTTQELFQKTAHLANKLNALNVLAGWMTGVHSINEGSGSHYNILTIDVKEKKVRIYGFAENELVKANKMLAQLEMQAAIDKTPEPVLVAVGDSKNLKKAYPNYYLDMQAFLDIVRGVVQTVKEPV